MRKTSLCLCLIWFLPATTLVHGGARDDPPPKNRAATLQAYIVRLTEIRLSDLLDQNLSAKEVLKSLEQMKKEGKVEMMETVQLSVLDENDSVAQFQRSVPVATGRTFAGPRESPIRNYSFIQVGTKVRLAARSQADRVMLEIEYEASRITGKGQEDSPPETESVVYKTNLSMGDGHSVIVGSNTAAKTSLLLVSVQKQ